MWPELHFDTLFFIVQHGFCLMELHRVFPTKMCFVNAQDYLYLGVSLQVYILTVNKDTVPYTCSHTVSMLISILCSSGSSVSLKYCRQKRSKLPFLCLLINDVHAATMPVEELFALLCLAKSWEKNALVLSFSSPLLLLLSFSLPSAYSK